MARVFMELSETEEEEEEWITEDEESEEEYLMYDSEGEEEEEEEEQINDVAEEEEQINEEEEEEDTMESEEDLMESEEDITESEEEEEEAEELEEMRPPVVTSWMGPDGITVHGILAIDDGIIRLKNRCRFDDCSICYKPSTTQGKHQICCLPCGHMYGFSCIKKWLLLSSSNGKCPQCNTVCSSDDAILLYPPRLCDVTAHQKASPATLFPFTRQGFLEFKEYESSRLLDARLLRSAEIGHRNILLTQHNDLLYRKKELMKQRDNLLTQAEELEERAKELGQPVEPLDPADAFRRHASLLEPRIDKLGRRTDALKQLASALSWRIDELEQRSDAYKSRLAFYLQMYKEHWNRKQKDSLVFKG